MELTIAEPKPYAGRKAVVLLSGGIDSSVALAQCLERGESVAALFFAYGQRHHDQEDTAASAIAEQYGVGLMRRMLQELRGSTLTDMDGTLTGTPTVVPGRNLIFIAHALSIAARIGAQTIVIGATADDAETYADCRPKFYAGLNAALAESNPGIGIWHPFTGWTKKRVVEEGRRLGVPLALTWSCYAGGELPCGECGACIAREEALS